MLLKYLLFIVLFFISTLASAQVFDTLSNNRNSKDSIAYTNLKMKMSKTKFSKTVYKLLFRDVYNKRKSIVVNEIETNPFTAYEGMTIQNITIVQLDMLGESVYDTTRKGNKLEKFVSKTLHTNTREKIIRKSLLLFSEGDAIKAQVFKDTERLLRQSNIIVDARILVVPRPQASWQADVIVLIQDSWSLKLSGGGSSYNKFNIGVENINVNGSTHSQKTAIRWETKDTLQKFQFRTIYTIPYIGKTFITGQASFIWERDTKQQAIRFFRPFLTTDTKYAGAIEAGHSVLRQYKRQIDDTEVQIRFKTEYNYYDGWIGRAFKFPFQNSMLANNARIVTAVRHSKYNFLKRPYVSADSNKIYWNKNSTLISLGYSNRNYKRDVLIYGFGRTEDVPIGNLFALTLGTENTEYGQRGYGGVQYASGQYIPHNLGYAYLLLNAGTYYKNGKTQEGVLSGQLNYISNLIPFQNSFFRQFLTIRYTHGINRDPLDYLNISRENGIRGVRSEQLIGTKRFTIGTETVFFSDKSLLGFRIAYFVYADIGLVNSTKSIWKGPLYQGYGMGVRLRNENLIINTLQLRIGYYPNIPDVNSSIRGGVEGNTPLKLRDFDISAPSIVPLL